MSKTIATLLHLIRQSSDIMIVASTDSGINDPPNSVLETAVSSFEPS